MAIQAIDAEYLGTGPDADGIGRNPMVKPSPHIATIRAQAEEHHCMVEIFDKPLQIEASASRRLSGLTFTVKDAVKVRGTRLTAGLGATLVSAGPAENQLVSRLLEEGAACLGVAASSELVFDLSGELGSPLPRNPCGAGLQTGGSSSGSAVAVRLGFGDFSVVTDTGGSARVPAACCGVIGFKPSQGRLSTEDTVAVSETCDHLAVIVNSFDVLSRLFGILDLQPKGSEADVVPERVGVGWNYLRRHLTAETAEWIENVSVSLPASGIDPYDVDLNCLEGTEAIYATIVHYEAYRNHRALLHRNDLSLSEPMRMRLVAAGNISDDQYADALEKRRRLCEAMAELSVVHPLLLLPTLPAHIPARGQRTAHICGREASLRDATLALTSFANLIGAPAVSFPIVAAGVVQNAHIVGLRANDAQVVAAAGHISNWFNTYGNEVQ